MLMFPIGHVASAVLLGQTRGRRPSVATVAASQIPDLLDKPFAWVLRRSESSHLLAHSLVGWLLFKVLASALFSERRSAELSDAYLSHLLADELHHGRVPWLYPFSSAKRRAKDRSGQILRIGLVLELIGATYLAVVWLLTARHRDVARDNRSD
jgi:hypothetical protein